MSTAPAVNPWRRRIAERARARLRTHPVRERVRRALRFGRRLWGLLCRAR